jgi:hypothetical protein
MSKRKVKWFTNTTNLNEIYQPVGTKFSFVNEINGELTQCHQWIKCRDYLHDAIRTALTGNPSSIFGFKFSENNPKLDLENTKLLVSQPGINGWIEFRSQLTRSLKLINYFETLAGEKLSTIKKVQGCSSSNFKHVWMFTGPKMWISAPHLISMYTFLIRLGAKKFGKFNDEDSLIEVFQDLEKKFVGDRKDNDIRYLSNVKKKLKKLVVDRKRMSEYKDSFSKVYYLEGVSIMDFHNRSGMVSTCAGVTPFDSINNFMTKEDKKNG